MTSAITRRWKLIILVVALTVSLMVVWVGARTMDGIQQAKLATATVHSLELRLEAFENGSVPDIASLHGIVAQVEGQLREARSSLTPFIQFTYLMGWVPRFGPELRSSQDMLDLGGSLAQASRHLLTAVEIATSSSPQWNFQPLQGNRFNEDALRNMEQGEPFFRNALIQLEQAKSTIQILEGRDLSPRFQGMVNSARQMMPELETFARTGLAATQLWENFFGYEYPRTYLLVAQNSDELRATGGFIPGAWVLTLDRGEIVQLQFWDTVDVDDLSAKPPLPPQGLLQSLWAGVWLFRDTGWYPDFPTSARAMEQIFELGQDISVDGIITLDQWAVQAILDTIGPIALYTGEILDSNSYVRILEEKTDTLGREFMDTALQALLDRLREQGTQQDMLGLLATLNKSLQEKHVLMFFHDPALQEVAMGNGWSGALKDVPGDYLMVVDSNVGFSKVNRNIAQSIDYTVDLSAEGEAEARLDILYTNRSSETSAGSCNVQSSSISGSTYLEQKNTCYWDYLRVYVPADSILSGSSPFPMPQGALYRRIGYNDIEDTRRIYSESGKTVFAGFFNLDVGESRRVAFTYDLPGYVVQRDGGRLTYQLLIQSQPGTRGLPLEVTIRLPVGYRVHSTNMRTSHSEPEEFRLTLNLDSDITIRLELEKG